jgi:hypothetical protein
MPRSVARLAPVAVTALVLAPILRSFRGAERHAALVAVGGPAALALTNLSVCFGTLSWEYHTVTTLGTISVLVLWTELAPWASRRIKALTCGAYCAFLVVAFRVLDPLRVVGPRTMSAMYVLAARFLRAWPWRSSWGGLARRRRPSRRRCRTANAPQDESAHVPRRSRTS